MEQSGKLEMYIRNLCLPDIDQFIERLELEKACNQKKTPLQKKVCVYVRRTLENCFLEKKLLSLDEEDEWRDHTYYPAKKWHDDIRKPQYGKFYIEMAKRVWSKLVSPAM